jgi:hypothetical protein
LTCIHADREQAADQAAHAGAPNPVHRNMVFFEITKNSDVRQPESGPAAQCNSNRWSIPVATFLGYGAGWGEKPRCQFRKPELNNAVAFRTSY